MPEAVIKLNHLTRRFGAVTAVDDLSYEVYRGEVFGCLGHNGAGKTTSIRLLNGVLNPTSGGTVVLGLDPASQGTELRRRTGVLTETPSLDERLSARENLSIYADLYGVPYDRVATRVNKLLERFQLHARADEKLAGYSKGMKQRLALARALIHEPEVLFLDEPTAGLDPVAARSVRQLITQLSERGRTVFLCTHNLVEAQRLCDRVAVLERGRLLELGTVAELGKRLGTSQRLELEVSPEDRTRTLEVLQNEFQIAGVRKEGDALQLSGVMRDEIPGIVAGLAARGVQIFRVSPRTPSLEEVYFALHRSGQGEPLQ